jgi:hypothetical protein
MGDDMDLRWFSKHDALPNEPLIAMDNCETLVEAGATIVGPAYNVGRALKLVEETEIDAAVSDFRLETMTAVPLANRLIAMGVPFLFHTSVENGVGGNEIAISRIRDLSRFMLARLFTPLTVSLGR